jgi:serine/threonine protein kinase/tetratricopeptide (TPR) repeat protein
VSEEGTVTDPLSAEKSIFLGALDQESSVALAAYLDQACGDNAPLRAAVEGLLAAHQRLDKSPRQPCVNREGNDGPIVRERAGTMIGPYKLLQTIGEGGMGTVYLAEQTQPVQRRVALKIIKAGMDSRQLIARFEQERQALALMDHPNIAKVLDAGTIEANGSQHSGMGRPYFVMELVKGVPITRYCDERHLTLRQRLELFIPVCQAVQHAHQKAIIHRDLKPSNVLIASYDGVPVPKVIDFGVAKANGPKLTEETLFTEFGAIIGTLEYMSPEQAELNNLDIDTRSDIYSLGVLLYELLTGTTPLERKRLKESSLLEVLRIIREEEPPRPSTRLGTTEQLPAIAANRGVEPKQLSGLVRGELDWIVMKALEKDRNRRYETANGLARDLERYLRDEPVHACPPSTLYRFRKFARRHQRALLTLALLGTMLVVAVILLAISNRRIDREKRRAEENYEKAEAQRQEADKNFQRACDAVEQMLAEVGPRELAQVPHMEPVRRALLEKAVGLFDVFLQDQRADPEVRQRAGQAYYRVGHIHWLLGEPEKAARDYAHCRLIYQQLLADSRGEARAVYGLSVALCYQAHAQRQAGRLAEAEQVARQAQDLAEQLPADAPSPAEYRRLRANCCNQIGDVLRHTNRLQDAEAQARRALGWTEKLDGGVLEPLAFHRLHGAALNNLALVLTDQARYAETVEVLERAVREDQTVLQSNPWDLLAEDSLRNHCQNLGNACRQQGKLDEAGKYFRQALALDEQRLADFPRATGYRANRAASQISLALVLYDTGSIPEAEALSRAAIPVLETLAEECRDVSEYRFHLALGLGQLALFRQTSGALPEAEPLFRRAISYLEQLSSDSPEEVLYRQPLAAQYGNLGNLLSDTDRLADAETAFRKGLVLGEKLIDERPHVPDSRARQGSALYNLALLLVKKDDLPQARSCLDQALLHTQAVLNMRPRYAPYREAFTKQNDLLGDILWRQKRYEEAEAVYNRTIPVAAELVEEFPGLHLQRSILAKMRYQLALRRKEERKLLDARQLLEQAVAQQRVAVAAAPADRNYRELLRRQYAILSGTLVQLRDHAAAAETAAELPRIMPEGWREYQRAAGYLAYCVLLAANDPALSPEERACLKEGYADQAMTVLREAVARGYKDSGDLEKSPFPMALGGREDFRKLLAELKKPAR